MLHAVKDIFRLYGGMAAILSSNYFYASLFISILLWRDATSGQWAANIKDYLPPVLGFTFAALAIVMAIGDDDFRRKMAQVETIQDGESDLAVISASLCWFILVQICAVLLALIFEAQPIPTFCHLEGVPASCYSAITVSNDVWGFFGCFLLIYSFLLIIAATSQMFTVFRLYLGSSKPK